MTKEQYATYSNMDEANRKLYFKIKNEHPDWSFEQIINKITIMGNVNAAANTFQPHNRAYPVDEQQELTDYENLPDDLKKYYDFKKAQNPALSHRTLISMCSMQKSQDEIFSNGAQDVEYTPELAEKVVRKSGNWLEKKFPEIYEKYFRPVLDRMIDYIREKASEWIKKGWEWIKELFSPERWYEL